MGKNKDTLKGNKAVKIVMVVIVVLIILGFGMSACATAAPSNDPE